MDGEYVRVHEFNAARYLGIVERFIFQEIPLETGAYMS